MGLRMLMSCLCLLVYGSVNADLENFNEYIIQDEYVYIFSNQMTTGNEARATCSSNRGSLAEFSDHGIKDFLLPTLIELYAANLVFVEIYQYISNPYYWRYRPDSKITPIDSEFRYFDFDSYTRPPKGNLSSFRMSMVLPDTASELQIQFCYTGTAGETRIRETILKTCNVGWLTNFILSSTVPGIQIYNYRFEEGIPSNQLFLSPLTDFKGLDITINQRFPNFSIPDITVFVGARSNRSDGVWKWNNGSIVTDEDYPHADFSTCQEMSMPLTYDNGINLRAKDCENDEAFFVCKNRLFIAFRVISDTLYMFSSIRANATFAENTCSLIGGSLAQLHDSIKDTFRSFLDTIYDTGGKVFIGTSESVCKKDSTGIQLISKDCTDEEAYFVCSEIFSASLQQLNCGSLTWKLQWTKLAYASIESQNFSITVRGADSSSHQIFRTSTNENSIILRNFNNITDSLLVSAQLKFLPSLNIPTFLLNATLRFQSPLSTNIPSIQKPLVRSSSGKCIITWSHNRSTFENINYEIKAGGNGMNNEVEYHSSNYGLQSLPPTLTQAFEVTDENVTYVINTTKFLPNVPIGFQITAISDCGNQTNIKVNGNCTYVLEKPKLNKAQCSRGTALNLSWRNLENIRSFLKFNFSVKAQISNTNRMYESPFTNYGLQINNLTPETNYKIQVTFSCGRDRGRCRDIVTSVEGSTGSSDPTVYPVSNLKIISSQGCYLEWMYRNDDLESLIFKIEGNHNTNATLQDLTVKNEVTANNQQLYQYKLPDIKGNVSFEVEVFNRNCQYISERMSTSGICYESNGGSTDMTSGSVLIVAIVVVILVVLVVVGVLLFRKFHKRKAKDETEPSLGVIKGNGSPVEVITNLPAADDDVNDDFEESIDENPYANIGEEVPMTGSETVLAKNLVKFYINEISNNFSSLGNQFKKLVQVSKESEGPHDISSLIENKKLNRFKNIYPYDKDLVSLSNERYINASHIKGFTEKRSYIATQGPKSDTTQDFWRMIWLHKSPVIVMLCNCIENSKKKSEMYWPKANSTITKGDLKIVCINERPMGEVIKREFNLTKSSTKEQHSVTQFQYTSWPDHGVPIFTSTIVHLRKLVNKEHMENSSKGPIVVHCSAGAGRTGTYIAIDNHTQELKQNKQVNVYNGLLQMRASRKDMVQNADQYIFVHKILVENLVLPKTYYNTEKLLELMRTQNWENIVSSQFDTLSNELFLPFKNQSKQSDPKTVYENDVSDSAFDHHQVLFYQKETQKKTPMNAHYITVPYLTKKCIACADPYAGAEKDFWEMIIVNSSSLIIGLEALPFNQVLLSKKGGSSIDLPGASILIQNFFETKTLLRHELIIKHKSYEMENVNVTHIIAKSDVFAGNDENLCSIIQEFIEEIETINQNRQYSNTVVYCRDGLNRTGLFLATANVLEQIKCEGNADLLRTLKDLRECRPGILPRLADFKRCYSIANCFSLSFSIYANV